MSTKDLVKELEETIDRLIENAITLESINGEEYIMEKELLEQTQESLLAHLFYLDEKISGKSSTKALDCKKIKEFSFDNLERLESQKLLRTEKIKLSKQRLKSKNTTSISN